ISGITEDSEVINARVDGPYSTTYDTLKLRLDAMSALLKGIVDGDFENRVSDLEDEVEDARGEFDALVDRLDDTDGRIADNAGEIDSAKVKILQLEQENKQLKKIVEDSNPTQSPRVTSTGYGVVSLPKNAGQGPMDVKVEGLTLKNELDYNTETWEEWSLRDGSEVVDGKLKIVRVSLSEQAYINASFKPNAKYGLLMYVHELTTPLLNATGAFSGTTTLASSTGNQKAILLTTSAIERNALSFKTNVQGTVTVSNVRIFELPPGSEIESDFETLSADELAMKYPYVQGGVPRNTSGTFRVRSVGKNLFDKSKVVIGRINSNGTFQDISDIRTSDYIKVTPNTSYVLYNAKINSSHGLAFYDANKQVLSEGVLGTGYNPTRLLTTGGNTQYLRCSVHVDNLAIAQLEKGTLATPYEPYISSEQYVNGPELRSLPNGVADSIENGKLIQRVKEYVLQSNDIYSVVTTYTYIDYVLIYKPIDYIDYGAVPLINGSLVLEGSLGDKKFYDSEDRIGYIVQASNERFAYVVAKGTFANITEARAALVGKKIKYQLATPIETPVQVSGSVQSYPAGTVYIEPAIADAGVYDGGLAILNTDFPIAELESIQKIDFQTGLSTELDVGQAVIAGGGLSFTHPGLTDGDIVFVTYLYDDSNYTAGKATCEYYDSRFVLKDDVTGKFYKEVKKVENGELVTQLVEV
ncbi:MAG: hypothetical protein GX166_03380, partial [Clostridiaceae bacterium]|nr:hypothetical protein [Clostridiaceae bacterium]